ncbi:MAG: hypothetical protein ACAI44_22555 [Candidatus Sericytochromatia bacterium]
MKALNPWEQENTRRAKAMLRKLWLDSGLSQKALLTELERCGQPTKKTTLSMWLNAEGNLVRPKLEALEPLVSLCLAGHHRQIEQVLDELRSLLGYASLETTEMLRNRLSLQLDQQAEASLQHQEAALQSHLSVLDHVLQEVEPRLFEYDKGAPVIRVSADDKYLVRELLQIDSLQQAKAFRTADGDYEIPLTRVQSLDTVTDLVNAMNEGIRVLRAFVERHLLTEGSLTLDAYPRVEDFLSYAWEIADRLLYHNRLCKSIPALKRTLLRMMATCWGIRYLLRSQEGNASEIEFQNILQLKGNDSQADIACSVAVFMGVLARQLLKFYRGREPIGRGLALTRRALEMLRRHHVNLPTEQERFFYKKEIANLCYDTASLLLWASERYPEEFSTAFTSLMQQAHEAYTEVLSTVNLFQEGLSEQRAAHIRCFYLISLCWIQAEAAPGICEINKQASGSQLNEHFWTLQMAKAVAWGVLAHKAATQSARDTYRAAGLQCIHKALLVPGLEAQTHQELKEDFILHHQIRQLVFDPSSKMLSIL